MTGRTVLGIALAGLAMFIWGALSHMVLGLGEAGIRNIPNESAMLSAVRTNIDRSGFYMFPGMPDAGAVPLDTGSSSQLATSEAATRP